MSKQQCEICGQMKEQHEMAKSYKHRCKECVARLTRIDRLAAKQRAENISQQLEGTGYTLMPPAVSRDERIRIATAVLQGRFSVLSTQFLDREMLRSYVVEALQVADILLEEVDNTERKGGNDD